MPAYLATVPHQRSLEAPIPDECDEVALPLLEAIEQHAAREDVPVDSRIERGRSPRHSLALLFERERYDALVLAARSSAGDGFAPADIAWALEHAPGDVFVIRPARPS